jgi:hypothetical protein
MLRVALVLMSLVWTCTPLRADNCETLKAEIDARIKASGVASFSLAVVDAGAPVIGKVVGSCGLGAKRIVYLQTQTQGQAQSNSAAAASAAPATKRKKSTPDSAILTECKDGSMSLGATCK